MALGYEMLLTKQLFPKLIESASEMKFLRARFFKQWHADYFPLRSRVQHYSCELVYQNAAAPLGSVNK